MPTTRSSSSKNKGSKSRSVESPPLISDDESQREASGSNITVEDHIQHALKGVTRLRNDNALLLRKIQQQKDELDRIHNAEDVDIQPKRGKRVTMSADKLKAQVQKLNDEVVKLRDARSKDRKRIKKLKARELHEDAEDLIDPTVAEPLNSPEVMRKLLRRFYILMTSESIEDAEECGVCMEKMELNRSSGLHCQHVFCNECLSRLASRICPTCRQPFLPEDMQNVTYTAQHQWDELLEVAQEWAKLDKHGDPSEPEDTDEEPLPFIDDGDENATVDGDEDEDDDEEEEAPRRSAVLGGSLSGALTPSGASNSHDDGSEPDLEDSSANKPSIPDQQTTLSYARSPRSLKRQKMEELVASRKRLKQSR